MSLVLILLCASLHHALRGRRATDLARAGGSQMAMLGALHLLHALGGAWAAMLLAAWGWRRAGG